MAALQLVEDEGLHLLFGDLSGLDVCPDLLRRKPRVARPERDIHHPDGIGGMSQQLNVDRGFHRGPVLFCDPQYLVSRRLFIHNLWKSWGERIMSRMPVTEADFQLQGRVDNYRERLYQLLIALDRLVREELAAVNREKLDGKGTISYEPRPPRRTLALKTERREYRGNP